MLAKSKLLVLKYLGACKGLTLRSNQKVKQNGLVVEYWGLEMAVSVSGFPVAVSAHMK